MPLQDHQIAAARAFHALHQRRPLLLPTAWDAASARILAAAGSAALGTSSAAIAWSLGVPDGEQLSRSEMLGAARRVRRAVCCPVSVDIEGGYGDETMLADTVRTVIELGAVGINLEDSCAHQGACLRSIEDASRRIRCARAAANAAGLALFINARVDVFLHGDMAPSERLNEAIRRAEAYAAAGADGIFVIGASDPEDIAALVQSIPRPLNVWLQPGMPGLKQLGALGVARVSLAVLPFLHTYSQLHGLTSDLLQGGAPPSPMLGYAAMQALSAPMHA